jgi:formate hydrogenlyase transcriptional activator
MKYKDKDEIDALPLELQAKLLRVLESGEFERLGSPRTVKVDVRIISATNRDLARLVSEGGQTPKHVPF